MYSLVDGLKEILRLADLPGNEVDPRTIQAKILEFAAALDAAETVPDELLQIMPLEMKKSAIAIAIGVLMQALEEAANRR